MSSILELWFLRAPIGCIAENLLLDSSIGKFNMNIEIKLEVPTKVINWVVVVSCLLGFAYLVVEFSSDSGLKQPKLSAKAKRFSALPEVSPNRFDEIVFHPGVKKSAKKAFESGDLSGAVRHAVIALYEIVRKKSGIEGDGTELIQRVFRGKKPVLRFRDLAPPHIKNVESGVIDLLEGFSKSVRNVYMHSDIKISKKRALQEISLACYLAERVEDDTILADTLTGESRQ